MGERELVVNAEWQGVLPDGYVRWTSAADWHTFLDLIRSQGWAFEYSVGGAVAALPDRAEAMFDRPDDHLAMVQVRPVPDVLVKVFVYDPTEINFDVDIRELQGQEQLDVLCDFFGCLGRSIGKPVVMTPEGMPDKQVLVYEADHDRIAWLPGSVSGLPVHGEVTMWHQAGVCSASNSTLRPAR